MKLSQSLKLFIGFATGIYVLLPLTFIPLWFLAVASVALSAQYSENPPMIFFLVMFGIFTLVGLFSVLHITLPVFYLIHLIKNHAANDTFRILTAVGLYLLPWLAMPVYFFLVILPSNPPGWMLTAPPKPEVPPEPVAEIAPQGNIQATTGQPEPQSEPKPSRKRTAKNAPTPSKEETQVGLKPVGESDDHA